ncbi:MAG: MMPL family transporter, partial [Bacteroidales bacterium]|nr:MMPL family transporter [Bacteroidales bacterium]
MDFLPLESNESEMLEVYQNISGADRIICLFSNPGDADYMVDAIDAFADALAERDSESWCSGLVTSYDMTAIRQVMDFAYDNVPYFLGDADYVRIDSLLSIPGYIGSRLRQDRNVLMFPTGGVTETSVACDPLGLFGPVMDVLSPGGGQGMFELYDGYIFTPDMSRAIVMLCSPFGSSETSNNQRLLRLMREAADAVEAEYEGVEIHMTGGPAIAVGNSIRIKKDSVLAISLSAVLILLLLFMSFSSVWDVVLILLSIAWGWLFAMGGMSLLGDRVSIIVIGISSAILGIAVNYPLHLVAHKAHRKDIREAIVEITSPLIVGNITTVGAFLALVPLRSVALRDLGIFASLLLVG